MNKTILIGIVFIALLSSFASADIIDDNTLYYTLDTDKISGTTVIDYLGNNNGTILGGVTNTTGIINQALDFDGVNGRIQLEADLLTTTDSFSIQWWQESDVITGTRAIWRLDDDLYLETFYNEIIFGDGLCVGAYDGVWKGVCDGNPTTTWTHYVFTYNDSTGAMILYKNATIINTSTNGISAGTSPGLNRIGDASNDFDGIIDEFSIWKRVLTSSEIDTLYNSGFGLQIPYVDYFIITAKDSFLNETIVNFSANISGNIFTTTNGTINTNITPNNIVNISLYATTYENKTYSNYNTSIDLIAELLPEFFEIEVKTLDYWNGSSILNFTVNYVGTNYTTLNGTLNLAVDDLLETFTFHSYNYYSKTIIDANLSTGKFNTTLRRTRLSPSYSNYYSTGGTNYSRSLNYQIIIEECRTGTNYLIRYINGIAQNTVTYNCVSNGSIVTGSYARNVSGLFNISFSTIGTNTLYAETLESSFYQDLSTPIIKNLDHTVSTGINLGNTVEVKLNCSNEDYPEINNLIYLNDILISNTTNASGTEVTKTTTFTNGLNKITAICKTPFASNTSTEYFSAFYKKFLLWDEIDFVEFNLDNVTGARMYFDNEETIFNFKTENNNSVYITVENNTKARIELEYEGALIIPRYIDLSLLESNETRICANKQGVIHYEQLIISATIQPVTMKNIFAGCYIGADYTRYSYQDSYSLRAFTIDSNYELKISEEDEFITLAIIDGGLSEYHNLDTLSFKQDQFTIDIVRDALSISNTDEETIKRISYINREDTNDDLILRIYRLDNNTLIYLKDDFSNNNEFDIYLNLSVLTGDYNDSTVFKAEVISTRDGTEFIIQKIFNGAGKSGVIPSGLAFVFGILFLIAGLSLTAVNTTFGWYGILIELIAGSMQFLTVSEWYNLTLQVIALSLVLYTGLLISITNNKSVV